MNAQPSPFRLPLSAFLLCFALLFLAGCGFLSRQPALPRHAAIDSATDSDADEKFAVLVENADIIYFPSELVEPPAASEPSWRLVEALQRNGGHFILGWDLIGGEEQPLLDQWTKQEAAAEPPITRLHLHAAAREIETARVFLREANRHGAHFLALHSPPDLAKDEVWPGFDPPPGDFEAFVRRFPATLGTSETTLRLEYEAALRAEKFAAERVARYFRENRGEKLLVFLHRRQLGNSRGVPFFVAQKIKARQLVLDSRRRSSGSSQLMAAGRGWPRERLITRRFQVVDSSPGPGRDQL